MNGYLGFLYLIVCVNIFFHLYRKHKKLVCQRVKNFKITIYCGRLICALSWSCFQNVYQNEKLRQRTSDFNMLMCINPSLPVRRVVAHLTFQIGAPGGFSLINKYLLYILIFCIKVSKRLRLYSFFKSGEWQFYIQGRLLSNGGATFTAKI